MSKKKYDFAGWVTKNDIRCSDGVTIKHDAFKNNHGSKVPLVWNHNYDSPMNVLGYVELENHNTGVYGYGHFNDTEEARSAKEQIRHGDITSMSIGARKIKRNGSDVVHGMIYEVSLVLAGANPGAVIDTVITHSEDGDVESGIIYPGTLIHSSDDIIENQEEEMGNEEKTIGDVLDTMNDEQREAVEALLGAIVEDLEEDEEGEEEEVKQNVFNKKAGNENDTLKHSMNDALTAAMKSGAPSLKKFLADSDDETLKHGINSIEMLFPDAYNSSNGNEPIIYRDPNTQYAKILAKVSKSPFAKVRTLVADLTEEEARAKGYIKGNMKKEEFFSLIKRVTDPTTIYKKQRIDRDDIIDIVDFNVVSFMQREMRFMLEEELARAILVGDGRDVASEDKINETRIRPVITDHEFFTIQKTYTNASDFLEKVLLALSEYRGSGVPDMYIDPTLLTQLKLLKGTDNRYLFGDIPSTAAIAARMDLGEIIPTSFMSGKGAVIVNLADYRLGAAKGGQITNFDDFDIDYNKYRYLIETRLSGALTMPKSAIYMNTAVITGANDTKGGVTFGQRQADKTPPAQG